MLFTFILGQPGNIECGSASVTIINLSLLLFSRYSHIVCQITKLINLFIIFFKNIVFVRSINKTEDLTYVKQDFIIQ